VFNKSTLELKVPKATEDKFKLATLMYNSTPEIRMLKSIDKKIDEISTMLDDNIPIIEESVTNSGEKVQL
jgi:hypothetical protein